MYTGSWLCRTLPIFIKGVCKHHMGHGIIWQLISVNFLYQYMHWSYLKKLLPHEKVKTRGRKIFIVRVWKHPLTFPPKLLLFYKYLFFLRKKRLNYLKFPHLFYPQLADQHIRPPANTSTADCLVSISGPVFLCSCSPLLALSISSGSSLVSHSFLQDCLHLIATIL